MNTFTNTYNGTVIVGTAGTPVIHQFLDNNSTARYCSYSGQMRRRSAPTRLWEVAPGDTVEGRLCQKCFAHVLNNGEVK